MLVLGILNEIADTYMRAMAVDLLRQLCRVPGHTRIQLTGVDTGGRARVLLRCQRCRPDMTSPSHDLGATHVRACLDVGRLELGREVTQVEL